MTHKASLVVVVIVAAVILLSFSVAWTQSNAMPPEPKIKVGDMAPDFKLNDQGGKPVNLHDFRGKKNVALAFYVFAFSGGCSNEMKVFQQNLQKLEAANTQVLGVSIDSTFANKAWADQLGVDFPLLSDLGGDTSKAYGIYNPQTKAARRVTFLIDKNGKVLEVQTDKQALDPTNVVAACERKKG